MFTARIDMQTMFLLFVRKWTYYVILNVTTTSKRIE